jgi:hypothetical protein
MQALSCSDGSARAASPAGPPPRAAAAVRSAVRATADIALRTPGNAMPASKTCKLCRVEWGGEMEGGGHGEHQSGALLA